MILYYSNSDVTDHNSIIYINMYYIILENSKEISYNFHNFPSAHRSHSGFQVLHPHRLSRRKLDKTSTIFHYNGIERTHPSG